MTNFTGYKPYFEDRIRECTKNSRHKELILPLTQTVTDYMGKKFDTLAQ